MEIQRFIFDLQRFDDETVTTVLPYNQISGGSYAWEALKDSPADVPYVSIAGDNGASLDITYAASSAINTITALSAVTLTSVDNVVTVLGAKEYTKYFNLYTAVNGDEEATLSFGALNKDMTISDETDFLYKQVTGDAYFKIYGGQVRGFVLGGTSDAVQVDGTNITFDNNLYYLDNDEEVLLKSKFPDSNLVDIKNVWVTQAGETSFEVSGLVAADEYLGLTDMVAFWVYGTSTAAVTFDVNSSLFTAAEINAGTSAVIYGASTVMTINSGVVEVVNPNVDPSLNSFKYVVTEDKEETIDLIGSYLEAFSAYEIVTDWNKLGPSGILIKQTGTADYVKVGAIGTAAAAASAITFGASNTFNVYDSDGLYFGVENNAVVGISGLSTNGYIIGKGVAFNSISSINGNSTFGIIGDKSTLAIYGGDSGLSKIIGVGGDNVTINGVAGASVIEIDSAGVYNFTSAEQAFTIGGDSSVTLKLNNKGAVVAITGLSASGYVEAVGTLFASEVSVNGKSVAITGDDGNLMLYGNSGESGLSKIAGVGGASVTISGIGGASQVLTDTIGTFNFASASQVFTIGGDDVVTFGMSGNTVTAINGLSANGYVEAVGTIFAGGNVSVNGQSVNIDGDEGTLTLYGEDSGTVISAIYDVGSASGVTVRSTGGANLVGTDMTGSFTFINPDNNAVQNFTLAGGDSYVYFMLDTAEYNNPFVYGVADFGMDGTNATLTGDISDFLIYYYIDNEEYQANIAVTNDSDGILSYMVDEDGYATLGGVSAASGSVASVDNTAFAYYTQVTGGGSYSFFGSDVFTVGLSSTDSDGVLFTVDDNNTITAITSLDKGDSVSGNFENGITVSGASGTTMATAYVKIAGDSDIQIVHDAFEIHKLSSGATIESVTTITDAYTDTIGGNSTFTVTDASGATFTVTTAANDTDGLTFTLDGTEGNIIGISSLENGSTLVGALNNLSSINGQSFGIIDDNNEYAVVGSSAGIGKILDVTGDATIKYVGGASQVITDTIGTFNFTSASQAFTTNGDDFVTFGMSGNTVTAIDGLSGFVLTDGSVFSGGFSVNEKTIDIVGDKNDIIIAENISLSGIEVDIIGNVGGGASGVTINNAGGAILLMTDTEGTFNFASVSQVFTVGGGDDSIQFLLKDGTVKAIAGLSGFVTADESIFADEFLTNGQSVAITGDDGNLMLYGNNGASGLSKIAGVGGASGVTINGVGGASQVITDTIGVFNFSMGGGAQVFTIGGRDNSVTFGLNGNTVNAINDFDEGANVISNFENGITVNSDNFIQVTGDSAVKLANDGDLSVYNLSDSSTIVSAKGISFAYTDSIAINSSLTVTDANKSEFAVSTGSKSIDNGMEYTLDGESGIVTAVDNLGQYATLSGNIASLNSVNGETYSIAGDDNFAVVGKRNSKGISQILGLSGKVTIESVGGATQVLTDGDGIFNFASASQVFTVSGDSSVTFGMTGNTVEAIDSLSGYVEAVGTIFAGDISVNGQFVAIEGDSDNLTLYGNSGESGLSKIVGVGGESVVINGVGGASQVLTDSTGVFNFASAEQVFTVSGDDSVTFGMTGNSVNAITNLDASGYVEAIGTIFASEVSVNGKSVAIDGDDGNLMLYGNSGASGLSKVARVGGDSVDINGVGGASQVITDSTGVFNFAVSSTAQAFTVSGDSSVTFELDNTGAVVAINDFANGTITGNIANVKINGESIEITGDSDSIMSYAIDESDNATLGEVSGEEVVMTAVAKADVVQVTGSGSYTFPTKETFALEISDTDNDGVDFILTDDTVTAINSFDKNDSVTGNFENGIAIGGANGTTTENAYVKIAGDSDVQVVHDALEIHKLSNGATISSVTTITAAYTDSIAGGSTFVVTDASGATFTVTTAEEDKDGVVFTLDGIEGNIIGLSSLAEGATLTGNIGKLESINGESLAVDDEDKKIAVVGADEGISKIISLTGDATIDNAGGASNVDTDKQGVFYFDNAPEGITVVGDDSVSFELVGNEVVGISGLNKDGYVDMSSDLAQTFTVNGQSIAITGDEDDIIIYGNENEDGISAIANVGGTSGVTLNNIAGASAVITDKEGTFTFKDTFTIGGDDEVKIGVDEEMNVTTIDSLTGYVQGESNLFTNGEISVNGQSVSITGDENDIIIYGNDDGITRLSHIGGTNGVTLNDIGDASLVDTDENGTFTFANGQTFTVSGESDSSVQFVLEEGTITGVESLLAGTLTADTNTNELDVNVSTIQSQHVTFETEKDLAMTIEDYKIVKVEGITAGGSVSGIEDATVVAEGEVAINGTPVAISDADTYGVVVEDGDAVKAYDVTGDATIDAPNMEIAADGDGDFVIGGESYTITDDDGNFNLTTDEDGKLATVDELDGDLVIGDGDGEFTINGAGMSIADTGDGEAVTVSAADDKATVSGLQNGDSISGSLSNAEIIAPASASEDESSTLTVNGNPYKISGDEDGVTISGADEDGVGVVEGLDKDASMMANAGKYTVNGAVLEPEDDDIIIGTADSAYIYDSENPVVRPKTSLNEVMEMMGLSAVSTNPSDQLYGPREGDTKHSGITQYGPLDKTTSDSLIGGISTTTFEYKGNTYDLNSNLGVWLDNSINSGAQSVDLSEYDGVKNVHMYGGEQSIELNDDGGNMVHVEEDADGDKTITLGDGGDLVIVDASSDSTVKITGGEGDDTVVVRGTAVTTFDMSTGGADMVVTYGDANATVSVTGYDVSNGGGIRFDDINESLVAPAIDDNTITFEDGTIVINKDGEESKVNVGSDEDGGTWVNLFAYTGDKQLVGFTNEDGGALDGTGYNAAAIMIGNKEGDKTGGSTIQGGAQDDTIYGGGGDSINAGDGDNLIKLAADDERERATVTFSEGTATVSGMNNGFADNDDVIEISAATIPSFELEDDTLTISGTSYVAILENVDVEEGDYVKELIKNSDDNTIYRVAIGDLYSTIKVDAEQSIRPNVYIGDESNLYFSEYDGDGHVDLEGDWNTNIIDGENVAVLGTYTTLISGGGSLALKGDDLNQLMIAGSGNTSMYADGGINTLRGYTDDDKETFTSFYVLSYSQDAVQKITDFEFATAENVTTTADNIEVQTHDAEVKNVGINGEDVTFDVVGKLDGTTEHASVQGAVGQNIRIDVIGSQIDDYEDTRGLVAQVNTDTVSFDNVADFFLTTNENGTVVVSDSIDSALVWLDEDDTGIGFVNIDNIDASKSNATAELVGNSNDNVIYAGTGETSLWGGSGGNDLLVGGDGEDTFYYVLGDGNDTMDNVGDGDEVILRDCMLSDLVASAGETSVTISIKSSGELLTVNEGGNDVNFKVTGSAGESNWYLNENREFVQK
ncbi:MAG: hypothetical protein K6G55_02025 [Selenomonadaceae bacterium]|nr:hypothetical protein [Selenomonadaceae bacterium]